MELKSLAFFIMIGAISGCWAWAFGARRGGFNLPGALMGIAISPALVSVSAYFGAAMLSHIAPSRSLFVALPLAIAASFAWWFGQRPQVSPRWPRPAPAILMGAALALAAYPFVRLLWAPVSHSFTPHDLSIYLLQAIDLNQIMQTGGQLLGGWWSYQNPDVTQPHSMSFPSLLAWGFLFVDAPGYGADSLPKALVAWTILSVIIACIAVCAHRGLVWGLAAGIVALSDKGFVPQVWGLSRDSFYIAPAIVLIGLLIHAKPRRLRLQIPLLLAQLITLITILLGHSLGMIYASSLFAGYSVAASLKYRLEVLRIPSIWLIGTGLLIGAALNFVRYFGTGAAAIGFDFPFYVDPFQISVLKSISPFAVEPDAIALASSVLRNNGIAIWWLLPIPLGMGLVAYNIYQNRLGHNDLLWLILSLSTAACFAIVLFLPIKLDGLSLAGAFVANFRYSFGVSILLVLLIVCSSIMIIDHLSKYTTGKTSPPLLETCAAMLLAATISYGSSADLTIDTIGYDNLSSNRDKACVVATGQTPRAILIDDVSMFYICRGHLVNAYSEQGITITGAEGDANIAAALDAQEIDAVALYNSPAWWSGTRLYQYLKRNWKLSFSRAGHAEVFLRP